MKQGWAIKTIADVCTFMKNGANIKQERGAGGVPITRIETLSGGVFNRDRLGYANIATPEKYLSYVLEYGDLLLSHINSKTYIGRTVVYVPENGETIIHGMNLLRLKLDFNLMSPFYFQYYTLTDNFKAQIANRRKDAVNQSSITTTDIKTISIPVPPIAEQEKIVAELDCLFGVIEKKKQQLKELDALAQSIFYEMFGDPIENDKGWEVKTIKEVAPQKTYKGAVPSINGKYWLLNLDMVEPNTGEIVQKCYFSQEDIGNSTIIFNSENVLYSKLRPYLNKVIVPYEVGYATSELVPLCPNKDILNRIYFAHLLRSSSFVDYINGKVAGAKMPRVSMDVFRQFGVILPPLALQQDFASKIKAIEKQKELIRNSIQETETLFNSRMDYYFG